MAKPKSNKGEECYFLEKKEEVGRRSFEQKSIEEKQEFSVMTVFSLAKLQRQSISCRR